MLTINELKNAFAGKKVLITGHTGFKGSWLSLILNDAGAQVTGFALEPISEMSHFNMLMLDKKINHIIGDIRDYGAIVKAINEFKPEYVFHLAAQALVRESYDDPISTFSVNIQGSVNLLEAVRHCESIKSLVFITSDKCYENVEWIWGYRENDQLGGRDPYSASKAAAELVFSSYKRSFFDHKINFGAATTRAGNVIGGGDWAKDRIIPDCIRAIQSNGVVKLRSPNSTRPWQHVLEPLAGYLDLSIKLYNEPKKWSGAWNFGPYTNDVKTVQDVAEIIVKYIGKGRVEPLYSKEIINVHEAQLLQLNCDKANNLLGWYPRWSAQKTLEKTAEWYKQILNNADAVALTRSQIEEYFSEKS